jgi:peptidyl-prolyl cis-trans isomerase A (cyclophilin A)
MKNFLTLSLSLMMSFGAMAANPKVIIKTNKGDIEAELFEDKAPVTVKNFLAYVDKGHYKNTIFHRVINNFMIQGGGFSSDMKEKSTDAPIKNEADNGLKNENGTLAMARTMDVNSATAQFFINVQDNVFLDHRAKNAEGYGYAVFGKVTAGMPVINTIKQVKTGNKGMYQDVPTDPVVILDITRKK